MAKLRAAFGHCPRWFFYSILLVLSKVVEICYEHRGCSSHIERE